MNPQALAILALADRGIQPPPDPEAGAYWLAMVKDCLAYYRQRIEDARRHRAMYEARAQDTNLTEREQDEAQAMLEAIECADAEIGAYEQDIEPSMPVFSGNPLATIHIVRLIVVPPAPNSPYFKKPSVQQYLPHWNYESWIIDDAIVERLYTNWIKGGKKRGC